MNDAMTPAPADTVIFGTIEGAPEPGPADTLALKLVPGNPPASAPLMLLGSFNVSVDLAGRYSERMPIPVHVVVVSRETGRVYLRTLARQDDMPPVYLGAAAAPSVTREGPDGPSSAGISEFGQFSIDLKRHLGLPDHAERFDVFLWLEHILSEMVTATKPAEAGDHPGGVLFERPASIARIRPSAASGELVLSASREGEVRRIVGHAPAGPLSVIAHAVQSSRSAWTALPAQEGAGFDFEIDLAQLLPGVGRDERVLVIAVAAGERSPLLDMPAER